MSAGKNGLMPYVDSNGVTWQPEDYFECSKKAHEGGKIPSHDEFVFRVVKDELYEKMGGKGMDNPEAVARHNKRALDALKEFSPSPGLTSALGKELRRNDPAGFQQWMDQVYGVNMGTDPVQVSPSSRGALNDALKFGMNPLNVIVGFDYTTGKAISGHDMKRMKWDMYCRKCYKEASTLKSTRTFGLMDSMDVRSSCSKCGGGY